MRAKVIHAGKLVKKFLLDSEFSCGMLHGMSKHVRFYVDLNPEDAAILNRLCLHLSTKRETIIIRADAVRIAVRALAKKEKVA